MPAADISIFETTYGFIYQGDMRERVRLSNAVKDGAAKLYVKGRTYRVGIETKEGYTEGVERDYDAAVARALHLKKKFPNRKVRIRAFENDLFVEQVRFVTLRKTPDPKGDVRLCAGVRNFIGWVESAKKAGRLKGVRYAGGCVCKSTTSGGHSDHADCAAIDIFADMESMERMRDAARFNPDYFNLKYVILYKTIYFPDGSSKFYTGDYHAHVHFSAFGGVPNSAC